MPILNIVINHRDKTTASTTTISGLVNLLDSISNTIAGFENVEFKSFKLENYAVSGLDQTVISKAELIALKNHLKDLKDDDLAGLSRILGALHCYEYTGTKIDTILENELPKVVGCYLSKSDLEAKAKHFAEFQEKYKEILLSDPQTAPFATQFFDAMVWGELKRVYFRNIKVDYFADAVLMISK